MGQMIGRHQRADHITRAAGFDREEDALISLIHVTCVRCQGELHETVIISICLITFPVSAAILKVLDRPQQLNCNLWRGRLFFFHCTNSAFDRVRVLQSCKCIHQFKFQFPKLSWIYCQVSFNLCSLAPSCPHKKETIQTTKTNSKNPSITK